MQVRRFFPVLYLGVFLLAAVGCDGVKFKPIDGPPTQTQSQPKQQVVVVREQPSEKKSPRKAPRKSDKKAKAPERRFNVDTSSGFTFGQSGLVGEESNAESMTSNQPGLATEKVVKMVASLVKDSLDYSPTLVVWLIDQSKSASDTVRDFGRVVRSPYTGLAASGEDPSGAKLLTAVVMFGENVQFAVDPPSSDPSSLPDAIEKMEVDQTGREATFGAFKTAFEKYLPYRTQKRREVVFIIVTDESGDDANRVDELLDGPKRYGVPVYVIGVPAPFGRMAGLPQSVEAPAGYRPSGSWRPIQQGPESRSPERIQLGFWGQNAADLELIDSGFGPFALERLCRSSGGRFLGMRPESGGFGSSFNSWPTGATHRFDPEVMRRYLPDDVDADEYQSLLDSNAARMALHKAAQLSELSVLEFPQTEFVKQTEARMAMALSKAQQVAAKLEPAIIALHDTLEEGKGDRSKLKKPRWQASYDLAFGRALAAKARIEGYNAMLAALKRGKQFENDSSTTWVLEPADTIEASSALRRNVQDAQQYLQRVIDEHPGTPWALLAQRELRMSIGWKWSEK